MNKRQHQLWEKIGLWERVHPFYELRFAKQMLFELNSK